VERELELGDDAEVAAAAAKRPQEISVVCHRSAHHPSVGSNDFGADKVVRRQAGKARQPADATAKGEPGDASVADEAPGHRQPVGLGGGVELGPGRAAPARRTLHVGVDMDGLHRREVDHQAAVAERVAGVVVATAPDRDFQIMFLGECQRGGNVAGGAAAHDHRRTAGDATIPDVDRIGVPSISGQRH